MCLLQSISRTETWTIKFHEKIISPWPKSNIESFSVDVDDQNLKFGTIPLYSDINYKNVDFATPWTSKMSQQRPPPRNARSWPLEIHMKWSRRHPLNAITIKTRGECTNQNVKIRKRNSVFHAKTPISIRAIKMIGPIDPDSWNKLPLASSLRQQQQDHHGWHDDSNRAATS